MGTICACSRGEEESQRPVVIFKHKYQGITFQDVNGDIISEQVDIIVCPANNQLSNTAGLASNIVKRGGETIQQECNQIFDRQDECILPTGTVVRTTAGNLHAKHILHVVVPIWSGGDQHEKERMGEAVQNMLREADAVKAQSISIPNLSGGMFGFPNNESVEIMVSQLVEYIDNHSETSLKLIRFVNIDCAVVNILKRELERRLVIRSKSTLKPSEQLTSPENLKEAQMNHVNSREMINNADNDFSRLGFAKIERDEKNLELLQSA